MTHVEVWCAAVPAAFDPALEARYVALLNPSELQQRDRFRFDVLKRRYLLTRTLVRTVLSRHAPLAPGDWVFESNAHGRPRIAQPPLQAQDLNFNLSHTEAMVVLAIARGREIGVDVECTRHHAPLEVAQRFFSPPEAAALAALPEAQRVARFWDLWTLKESYIKARGLGLSLPLDGFGFRFDGIDPIALHVEAHLDDGRTWHFSQYTLPDDHQLALCLQQTGEPLPGCRFLLGLPLQQAQEQAVVSLRRSSTT